MSWEQSLDRWLTTPPEDDYEEIEVCNCDHCRTTLYHLDEVYYDRREGYTFCDKICFKEWLYHHIEEELDYYIELLEDNKDTHEMTLEAEFDDDEYYDGVDRKEDL